MSHRINERNTGSYTLEGELKKRPAKKVTKSFTESEVNMLQYLLNKVSDNILLDASDLDNQYFHDNGDIVISFPRERVEDLRSLIEKFS